MRPAPPPPLSGVRVTDEYRELSIAALFMAIGRSSGNAENGRAIDQLNGRLAHVRRLEPRLLGDKSQDDPAGRSGGRVILLQPVGDRDCRDALLLGRDTPGKRRTGLQDASIFRRELAD